MTGLTVGLQRLSTRRRVADQHQIPGIRLDAIALGRAHGLDPDTVDRLGTVVTEMATNIVNHAGSGQLVLRPVGEPVSGCVEILALDKGPGIADMTRAMRGSQTPPGGVPRDAGLSSIRGLADLFDIYSHPGRGTAVMAHVGARHGADPDARCAAESARHGSVGIVCVALEGQEECGDAWAIEGSGDRLSVLLVDGLGHGPEAAVAARAAMTAFPDAAASDPALILGAIHPALRSTRGAALSIAVIDLPGRIVCFAGVGNVDGRIVTADTNAHLIPQNGIVGHTMPRPHADPAGWPVDGRLVLHSDGISSRWRVDAYPGLLARHPALLAGVLFRDFARDRDDATVVVVRDGASASAS